MKKREIKYHSRPKRTFNWDFSEIKFLPLLKEYDSEKLPDNFIDDEPSYYRNLGIMMPLRAIKPLSKKEMKKRWYSSSKSQREMMSMFGKPWEKPIIKWVHHSKASAGAPVTFNIKKENHYK